MGLAGEIPRENQRADIIKAFPGSYLSRMSHLVMLVVAGWISLLGISGSGAGQSSPGKAAYRHYYSGLSLLSAGENNKAVSELNKAYRSWPDNLNFSLAYALGLSKTGKHLEGMRVLDQVRILDTDPYREHKLALQHFVRGMVQHYGGESQQAISCFEEGIDWQKKTGHTALLAHFYNALGYARLHHQGSGANHNGLGMHYHVHRRDLEKAIHDFQAANRIDPQFSPGLSNLAVLSDTLGKDLPEEPPATVAVRSRSGPSSLVTGLPKDVDRVRALADFEEVVLLVDISGSMTTEKVLCMGRTRFEVMRNLGLYLVDALPPETRIGLGTIGGDCGDTARTWESVGALSRRDLRYAVRFLNAHGTTPMVERLNQATELFSNNPSTSKGLFLISDGANVCPERGEGICEWAGHVRQKGITLNVLTFLDVSYNNVEAFAEYGCLADNTGGRIFYLDNVQCAFTDLSYQLLNDLDLVLPRLEKVYCWGPSINSLWAIFPESDP